MFDNGRYHVGLKRGHRQLQLQRRLERVCACSR